MEGVNWIDLAQGRDGGGALLKAEINLWVPQYVGNFLTSYAPVSFSRNTLLHGVFLSVILFTDETQITMVNITNTRNSHGWTHENPHEVT